MFLTFLDRSNQNGGDIISCVRVILLKLPDIQNYDNKGPITAYNYTPDFVSSQPINRHKIYPIAASQTLRKAMFSPGEAI